MSRSLAFPSPFAFRVPCAIRFKLCAAIVATLAFGSVTICGQTATPPTNATDFGSSAVGTAAAQTAVTFTVGSGGTMGTPLVLTQGTPKLDFQLGSGSTCVGSVTGGSCTVNVVFKPIAPGLRRGAVQLTNSNGTVIATAFLFGNGVGPRAVFTPGVISTVAGSYQPCANVLGSCGDGGPATAALFDSNAGIAVDAAGNIFIADRYDYRIRKVDAATGLISTVAGVRGKYCDPSTTPPGCYDGGPATQALLNGPNGVAVDGAGNLYITDSRDNVIRKVTVSTGFISTVASGQPFPWGITADRAGDVYWGDVSDNVIRKLTVSTGIVTTVAGNGTMAFAGDGGLATSASFQFPYSVAVDAAGNLYITDSLSDRIRKVTAATGIVTTIVGSGAQGYSGDGGPATSAALFGPRGIVDDGGGNLYFSDVGNNVIRKVDAAGIITTVAGGSTYGYSGDGGPAVGATLLSPFAVAVDSSGNLFVADTGNRVVRKVTATPASVAFASTIVGATSTDSPRTVTVSNTGTAALSFSVPASGINPAITAGYTLGSSSTCPQISASGHTAALATGTSCTAVVSFHPVAVSATNAGSLTLTDDSLNVVAATQSVALSGISTGTTGIVTPNLALTVPTSAAPGATVGGTLQFSSSSTSSPTGNVTIYAVASGSTTPIALNTVVSSTATGGNGAAFSFTAPTAPGTYSIYASYAGDTNFNGTSSSNSTLTVLSPAKGTATLSVFAPAGEVSGTAITGTVSAVFSGNTATPTGSVVVTAVPTSGNANPSVVLGTIPAATLATAGAPGVSLPYTAPAAGFYNVTASYVGDTNFNAATPSFATINVSAVAVTATSMTLGVPLIAATGVPFNVTLFLAPVVTRTTAITGVISLTRTDSSGITVVITTVPASQAIVTGGVTIPVSIAISGSYTLGATYAGDAVYGPSTATVSNKISINSQNATLTVTGPANGFVGLPVVYTVILSQIAGVPGPDITLTSTLNGVANPGLTVNSVSAAAVTGTVATLTFTSAGVYTITASYPGGGGLSGIPNLPATSAPITTTIIVSGSKPAFNMTLDDKNAADPVNTPLFVANDNAVNSTGLTLAASGGYNTPVTLMFSRAGLPSTVNVALQDASGKTITSTTPVTAGTRIKLSFSSGALATATRPMLGATRLPLYFAGGLLLIGLMGRKVRSRAMLRGLSLLGIMFVVALTATTLAACDATDCAPKEDGEATMTVTATPTTSTQGAAAQTVTVFVKYSYALTQ